MSTTYTLVAPDGQQYGPYPLETVQSYIHEGRIARESQMLRSDLGATVYKAGDFTELSWPGAVATSPAAQYAATPASVEVPTGRSVLDSADPSSVAEMRKHASWLWWFAIIWTGFAVLGAFSGEEGAKTELVVTLILAAFLGLLGYFAGRAHRWAFVLGLLMIALFAVEAVMDQRWVALAIRCWAGFEIFKGLMIAHTIQKDRG